ncbi:DUF3499 domain-containing protein [Corynebacterium pygosceleis]|uniref:DUF3499 domain-containing protein n=1 Tax=Corynebacterium pygosceleis TaxID=2800406 RepID=A0A9Q4GJB5_9CORY|nr:DUF3499 domain-containing protein [Corynebacterium pygosceleis]MCK7637697.1 DUF3499 domain-containing protein [Corynebacterium pygosceleis]MCK7674888.1 DUF3499 domain-containing protein [Corynebacterium pygosceleis]MCL0119523.1 DUF3499 domain-containing protein [Corynebacterium pygosceleis]MCX7444763.1 DUF3499 domain-containing protein [Corynebacterium pygosceleis]MCX7467974.1 DUF3499 domain-containing protein [Corynebacterium pygosceleis]
MSQFRRCSRPGCGKPAVATLTYAYAESTAVIGPLAPNSEPHSWDLCDHHASSITAPLGWELLRFNHIHPEFGEDDDLTALAEAVREAGRSVSGLVPDPESADSVDRDTDARHPARRMPRVQAARQRRRSHLRIVPDPDGGESGSPDVQGE